MNYFLSAFLAIVLFTSCNMQKKTTSSGDLHQLNGAWQLNYINGKRIAFEGLYPEVKPEITFRLAENSFNGNTGCNYFSGKPEVSGNKVSFKEPFAMTRKFCPGEGESSFLHALEKVDNYQIKDNELLLKEGETVWLKFRKK